MCRKERQATVYAPELAKIVSIVTPLLCQASAETLGMYTCFFGNFSYLIYSCRVITRGLDNRVDSFPEDRTIGSHAESARIHPTVAPSAI